MRGREALHAARGPRADPALRHTRRGSSKELVRAASAPSVSSEDPERCFSAVFRSEVFLFLVFKEYKIRNIYALTSIV